MPLDTAAFVGLAPRGPLFEAVEVTDWTQYVSSFGGYVPWAYLAYSAAGFFANGGRRLHLVRIDHEAGTAVSSLRLSAGGGDPQGRTVLLQATSPGLWGDGIVVVVTPLTNDRFDLTVSLPQLDEYEVWPGLTLDPNKSGYIGRALNTDLEGSRLINVCDGASWQRMGCREPAAPIPILTVPPGGQARLSGGRDALDQLTAADFRLGLAVVGKLPDVGLVAMPDLMPKVDLAPPSEPPPVRCGQPRASVREPATEPDSLTAQRPAALSPTEIEQLQLDMVGQCEVLRDRIALLDSLPSQRSGEDVLEFRSLFRSSYAAIYTPWLRVPDPLMGQGQQQLVYLTRDLPPSGYVAGIMARVMRTRGPSKPPANEIVVGARDVTGTVSPATQALLNENGINLIRPFPSRGLRIMGARTTSLDPSLIFVNVRLLLIYVEETLEALLQGIVFETNGPMTWEAVVRIASAFLDDLWRRGWLDGASAEEAYFVTCDATTTTVDDIDAGRLICLIGLLPPWPAEFITVRIGLVDGSLSVLAVEGGSRG